MLTEKKEEGLDEILYQQKSLPWRQPSTFAFFGIFVGCRRNVPHSRTILNPFDKFKTGLAFILTSVRHFVKFHANHVTRARVLIG